MLQGNTRLGDMTEFADQKSGEFHTRVLHYCKECTTNALHRNFSGMTITVCSLGTCSSTVIEALIVREGKIETIKYLHY